MQKAKKKTQIIWFQWELVQNGSSFRPGEAMRTEIEQKQWSTTITAN